MREFRLDTAGPAGDCAVLRVAGEVDVSTAPMLRERFRELAAGGTVHLIADLGQVDFLDCTGLGALVGGLRRLRRRRLARPRGHHPAHPAHLPDDRAHQSV